MSLKNDTIIPYVSNGEQTSAPISYLNEEFKAVDKPIIALSMTKEGIIQQANAIEVKALELAFEFYTITFTSGKKLVCTASHKLAIKNALNIKQRTISPLTGFTFLSASNLAQDDQILATTQDAYLAIESVVKGSGSYEEYSCMRVPMFGNFLIALGKDYIVSCTC